MTSPPSLEELRRDPFLLDAIDIKALTGGPRVIVSNQPFSPVLEEIPVRYIAPPEWPLFRRLCRRVPRAGPLLAGVESLAVAARLLSEMRRPGAVGLVSLGHDSGNLFCFLKSFSWLQGGPVLAYRVLLSPRSRRFKECVTARALRGMTLAAVWSRAQAENYHKEFGWPREKFIFIPYKANHSQAAEKGIPVGDYLFSGGNSERDYKTLFEAVRGLPIPVVVSTTKPELTRGLVVPENVIPLRAEEPFYRRLMAGSRFVAVSLRPDIPRGAGEPTILNAMWHGKPVVVADNVAAAEYVEEGVDGFVVPAGGVEAMRRRILELWNDPERAERMGRAGRAKVLRLYTHDQWKRRMQVLAVLVFLWEREGVVRDAL